MDSEPLGPSSRNTGLVISEIMYHPPDRPDRLNLEFIELYNSNPWLEDISGYRITGDLSFTFPPGTILPPQSFFLVVRIASQALVFCPWQLRSILEEDVA